jgi:ABC-2 type transport system permease protein
MMGRVWTIARRELRSYFDTPTAYVLIVAFLGMSLFLSFRTIYASNIATMRPFFDLLPMLFAVFVPAATMRTLAEERRGRTLDWLLSQPVDETEIVLGKFLGDWLFVLITMAGTLPTAIGILLVSEADGGIMAGQYIGGAFLAAQFVALGIWASSFTRNQITAFIVASALSFGLFLIGLPVVQIGLSPLIAGALAHLSILSHFDNVTRGVIDLRDVIYFVSTGGLFIMLAIGAVAKDRLSHGRAEFKRLRTGAFVVAALVLMVNLLGSHIRGRVDLTTDKLYTLAEGTRDILGDLDDLVQIKLYASSELPPEVQLQLRDVRDLLADMRGSSNGNLLITEVNPDDDEEVAAEAASYGIGPVEFNVLRDDEFEVRRGFYGLAVLYAGEQEIMPVIQRPEDLEFRLMSSIYRMTDPSRPGVAFVQGFGTKGPAEIPALQAGLGDRYEITSIDIAGDSAQAISHDEVEVLIVAGPTQLLDSLALGRVRDYVEGGGAALLLLEASQLSPQSPTAVPVRSGLEPLLLDRGIGFTGSMVLDVTSSERVNVGRQGGQAVIAPYPLWPVAVPGSDHSIVRDLNAVTFAWATSLDLANAPTATALWQTTEGGALQSPMDPLNPDQNWDLPEERLGVRHIAAAVTPEDGDTRGRLVVVGDASFMEPQYIQSNVTNIIFLANAIDWLAQDEALIGIRSKVRTPPSLLFEAEYSRGLLKWGSLLGVPFLFVLLGFIRVTGRKRRAEARWKEIVA